MIKLDRDEAAKVMNAVVVRGSETAGKLFPSVSTDSRSLQAGQCFFCLEGPAFDGHDFIPQAASKGASAVVHSKPVHNMAAYSTDFFQVENALAALQTLAHYVRMKWGGRLVAVTGSAGKTTTRNFTAALLGSKYRTHQSRGNLNNQIGVPLSLLDLEDEHETAVIELGMNHPGEIRDLACLALPDVAVLTNVAPVHLEFFSGGLEEIARAKGEILERLPAEGSIVYNADDPLVTRLATGRPARRISFGFRKNADVRVSRHTYQSLDGMDFEMQTPRGSLAAKVPFVGKHFLYNLAAAVAVALDFAVPLRQIKQAIGHLEPIAMRGRVLRLSEGRRAGATVWDDSYNANPQAMQSVLETVSGLTGYRRKIAALGDMLELGPTSPDWHRRVGEAAAAAGLDLLVAVGKQAEFVCEGAQAAGMAPAKMQRFENARQAADYLAAELTDGDLLVVKGSRGIGMDVVVRSIEG